MPEDSNTRQYGAIYADPPWRFRNYSWRGEGRNAIAHYDCLTVNEIAAMPVGNLAAKDCALFLWAVDPLLPEALNVIEAWGFRFKTIGFCWAKINGSADPQCLRSPTDFFTGLGYWTRANTELCLLATKGSPPRLDKGVRRLVVAPRREHSRKPDEVFDRIEKLVGGPYLEMFSRSSRPGWDCCGAEQGLFDGGKIATRRFPSSLGGLQDAPRTTPMSRSKEA